MPTQTSSTVDKALDVVDHLIDAARECTITELSRRTGMHKSTVLRLCATLAGRGYLQRGPRSGFRLGPKVSELARVYQAQFDLEAVVRPALARLRDQTAESASFYVPDGASRICLVRENSLHPIRHQVDEGARFPQREGVVGRVLLAFSGRRGAEYDRIRCDGFLDADGREPMTASVAAPVLALGGTLHGALVVSGPSFRFTRPARRRARALVLAACAVVASDIRGGTGVSV